jgi:NitT/TauT family transport system ATP-binding protein
VTHDLREAVYLADHVFVMSARPGRMVHVQPIDLPRPRSLATTYLPEFTALVQGLRDRISDVRNIIRAEPTHV